MPLINFNPKIFPLPLQMITRKDDPTVSLQDPYIAAKFSQRNIPYTFHLGNGQTYEGFVNKKLVRGLKYRIFVRAIVDTPQKVRTPQKVCTPEEV
jgi:hypothetical protein